MADPKIPRPDGALGPEPSQAQMEAGMAAAFKTSLSPKVPSFTANPEPYVVAIFRAMTAVHFKPASPPAKPRKPRTPARKPA